MIGMKNVRQGKTTIVFLSLTGVQFYFGKISVLQREKLVLQPGLLLSKDGKCDFWSLNGSVIVAGAVTMKVC